MSVTGQLEGAEELSLKLKGLIDDIKFKGGRFALRKAGQVLESAVVSEMMRFDREQTREQIFRNVKLRFSPKRFQSSGDIMFRLGILGGAASKASNESNPGGDTYYWRFLEFGTERVVGRRPMTRAVMGKESEIKQTFIREYNKALDRAIRRAAKASGGK
jgi:HK97 gp10 family phage protein